MKHLLLLLLILTGSTLRSAAQMSGNAVYNRDRPAYDASQGILYAGDSAMFIEASVMMNVPADEYIVVYGLAEDGVSVAEAIGKIDRRGGEFITALRGLGIGADDVFVDFVTESRVYDFETSQNVARERLIGYRVKKNVIIHYDRKELFEKIVLAAAKAGIHDLIKVDYLVSDPAAVKTRLLDEASAIIKEKEARYRKLFGIPLGAPMLIQQERYDIYFPAELYRSYTAAESGRVSGGYSNDRLVVQEMQKSQTFYFDALGADGFDRIINPVVIEPVVQFTLYLKMRYGVGK